MTELDKQLRVLKTLSPAHTNSRHTQTEDLLYEKINLLFKEKHPSPEETTFSTMTTLVNTSLWSVSYIQTLEICYCILVSPSSIIIPYLESEKKVVRNSMYC